MSEYLNARATAARLIAKKGSTVTLTRTSVSSHDPVTQTSTTTTTTHEFMAVALPPASARKFGVDLGDRIATEVYFAHGDDAPEVTPRPGDTISLNGRPHMLFWTQTYDPAQDGAVLTVAFAEARTL